MLADIFQFPLTLAARDGHVELALLLLDRGADIEEVNDEGHTPLMEAARKGHEEMVVLLLSQGAEINTQTEETQETALTLACRGGFLEVADLLIKAGADIQLGATTPLMEAAKEGYLELVRYLIVAGANVNATTATGDTALIYACENGHTDVADLLLQAYAKLGLDETKTHEHNSCFIGEYISGSNGLLDITLVKLKEHESEDGLTPLMKAARAGHLCTVQLLIWKGANVNKQTPNNDNTPLSLACAGGHLPIVELLLAHGADPIHKLKDNSTMVIEAAKGGHKAVVQLLLNYLKSPPPPPPDMSQMANSSTETIEVPKVPPHRLPLFIPEGSDQNPVSGSSYFGNVQTVPAFVGGEEGNIETEDKSSERFEACSNRMMKEAEMLHPSLEEQILQKQEILEELQRVERKLQQINKL